MPIVALPFGDPDTGSTLTKLLGELVYAMGRHLDFHSAPLNKPCTVVLAVTAVNPGRGLLSNGTSFKRSANEYWSSYGVDFRTYSEGDSVQKVRAIAAALANAVDQVPSTVMSGGLKQAFKTAADGAANQLAEESNRLAGS